MKIIEAVKSAARIVTNGGLTLVGTLLDRIDFSTRCDQIPVAVAHPGNRISCGDIITSAVGMMCSGNSSFESVREYGDDTAFYGEALDIDHFPSPERLRQRLDEIAAADKADRAFHNELRQINGDLLNEIHAPITPVSGGFIPVDIDVTPYNEAKSHKEGVSRTYKGCDGYAPINAYIGQEGYCINVEFREGSQHSQKGTPDFLVETIDLCNQLTSEKLLFRLDSGNDAIENMGILMNRGLFFIIKRNIRRESKENWLDLAQRYAPIHDKPREGKDVYIGSTWKEIAYKGLDGRMITQTVRIVFEITCRTIDKHGQVLLVPDIEVNTWWDNTGLSDKTVIELYHQHGTMEQYHSEIKSDMGMEKLPSGKFATNTLIHDLSMFAYNLLRVIGSQLAGFKDIPMRGTAFRRRVRTIIMNIIRIPSRIISHGNRIKMDLGCSNIWADTFIYLQRKICFSAN